MQGKVVIVTGAGSGIGRATAAKFAAAGASVIGIDRNPAGIAETAALNANIQPVTADITDHAALKRTVDEALKKHGKIDVLVNNAGYSFYERHVDSTLEHWRLTQAINIEAMYVLAKLVVPSMIERKYGRIVNVASTQAIAAEPVVGAYCASKGAICGWSRSLAVDLSEYGILVNVVAPGFVQTPMSVINGVDETTLPLFQDWYVKQRKVPLARPGQPSEIANAIFFLSGDECTYINGHTLVVDGGLTITF